MKQEIYGFFSTEKKLMKKKKKEPYGEMVLKNSFSGHDEVTTFVNVWIRETKWISQQPKNL